MYYVPGLEMTTRDTEMKNMGFYPQENLILVGDEHKEKQITSQGKEGLSTGKEYQKQAM